MNVADFKIHGKSFAKLHMKSLPRCPNLHSPAD